MKKYPVDIAMSRGYVKPEGLRYVFTARDDEKRYTYFPTVSVLEMYARHCFEGHFVCIKKGNRRTIILHLTLSHYNRMRRDLLMRFEGMLSVLGVSHRRKKTKTLAAVGELR